jgi:hypothetical protein
MINEVYNTVQALMNKNGRGIISPARFILFAENEQVRLLDNIIHEYRRARNRQERYVHDFSLAMLEDVMETFAKTETLTRYIGSSIEDYHALPTDYMAWGSASVDGNTIDKIPSYKKEAIGKSRYIKATESEPMCYIEGDKLYVLPTTIGKVGSVHVDEVDLSYYRTPAKPNWTYTLVAGKAIFNQSDAAYQDFELPYMFFNKLVTGILMQAGVHVREEFVVQSAAAEERNDFTKDNS